MKANQKLSPRTNTTQGTSTHNAVETAIDNSRQNKNVGWGGIGGIKNVFLRELIKDRKKA